MFSVCMIVLIEKKIVVMGDGSDSAALTVLPENCSQSSENRSNGQGKIAWLAGNPQRATLDLMELRSALLVP